VYLQPNASGPLATAEDSEVKTFFFLFFFFFFCIPAESRRFVPTESFLFLEFIFDTFSFYPFLFKRSLCTAMMGHDQRNIDPISMAR
jgi:hypothetical protein